MANVQGATKRDPRYWLKIPLPPGNLSRCHCYLQELSEEVEPSKKTTGPHTYITLRVSIGISTVTLPIPTWYASGCTYKRFPIKKQGLALRNVSYTANDVLSFSLEAPLLQSSPRRTNPVFPKFCLSDSSAARAWRRSQHAPQST